MAEFVLKSRAVPTTIVEDRVWQGFSDTVASEIRAAVVAIFQQTPTP
jgi:hypothetical protein